MYYFIYIYLKKKKTHEKFILHQKLHLTYEGKYTGLNGKLASVRFILPMSVYYGR